MNTILTVLRKEVLDNFRDRRTLISAILLGPLLGPALFTAAINLSLDRALTASETVLELPVIGADRAPMLIEFLASRKIDVVDGPEDYAAAVDAVKTGAEDIVLLIDPSFGEALEDGTPARVQLFADEANQDASRDMRRVRTALSAWNNQLASLRLVARGISPMVLRPINIDSVDVSTPSGRSGMLLGMMSYIFLLSTLVGGMYLAIDSTAGERERGSLEPLLSLPVTRDQLIVGKILAACVFMALSLALSIASFATALNFLPLEKLGMTPNFGPLAATASFLLILPFVLVGAALMTLVASFTKSYKEAQTWVSAMLFVPTLPIFVVSLLQVRPRFELMFVPSLSQHLLLVDLIKNEPVVPANVVASVVSTLLIGAVLMLVTARLYRREGVLG